MPILNFLSEYNLIVVLYVIEFFYQSIRLLFYTLQPFIILSTAFAPCTYLKYILVSIRVAFSYVDKSLLLAFKLKVSMLIWAAEAKFINPNHTKCLSVCALEVYYSACVATLCLWRGSTAFVTKLIYRHIMSYLPCVRIDWTLLLPTQFKAFSPENIYILMKTPTIPKFNFKWWS